ncbi:MAG: HAMP domain-containing protein [Pedosphaera sp.]|nr:HAMP domain-containing protein [Pedosphaera sp.]
MGKLRAKFLMSFRAKLLAPVIGVVLLVLAVTVWVVNQRITAQLETEAKRTLARDDAMFRNSQLNRDKYLLLRFRNLPNEPRSKAVFQAHDPSTVHDHLRTLMAEQGVDVVLFTPLIETKASTREPLAQKHDPFLSLGAFAEACKPAVQHALESEEQTDTIQVQDKLYNVVSVPVFGVGRNLIGALTLGQEIGETATREFSVNTGSQIVLLADGRVLASSVSTPETSTQFSGLFQQLSTPAGATNTAGAVGQTMIGSEHYFCSAGRLASLRGDHSLGYLLLTSYEQPLRALQATKQALLGVSFIAVLLGSIVVWYLVRWVTQPLQELRDSAEAVGQGDFSMRVVVRSHDECGELARVFNQMTENLKQSREQLELTVETLKTTQAQLIQSEKLSGIGEFVAGVAHELNNPLTSVMGFSELLAQADRDPQHKRHLDMIHQSALRCHKIVQSLLSFARRHQPERKVVCLNRLVEAALEILNYQLRTSNIEVTTRLDPELPQAMVDPHQVQQVFLNIVNNARQAIEAHQPKGWIRITTGVLGANVRVTIQDSGPGIPAESLSKIFDPFFTTKEIGKGTGLGLSLCYGIIKEHGGTITPRCKPGEGATFIIELPITHEPESPAEEKRTPETDIINPHEGDGKRVLVIDDEEPILHMVRDTLTCRGYEVDLAGDGEAGLRRLSEQRYDVTLCDWKMPGLSGQEVYERTRRKDQAQSDRIIFITGDTVNEKTRRFLEEQKRVCLPKPFTLAEFRAAIGKMLAAG